jgi:hypothetical protein
MVPGRPLPAIGKHGLASLPLTRLSDHHVGAKHQQRPFVATDIRAAGDRCRDRASSLT